MQEKQNPDGQTTIVLMVKRPPFWHSLMVKQPSAWWSNDHRFGQFWGFTGGHMTPSLIYQGLEKSLQRILTILRLDRSGRSLAALDQSGANARRSQGAVGPRGNISFLTLLRGCAR